MQDRASKQIRRLGDECGSGGFGDLSQNARRGLEDRAVLNSDLEEHEEF
ncbi:hypothetical protein [Nisaea denitrificans]|nr:hypothetical protein [Nisaea denitrificans]